VFFIFWNERLHKDNIRLKLRSPQVLYCLWTDVFCYVFFFCFVICQWLLKLGSPVSPVHTVVWSPVYYTSDHSNFLLFEWKVNVSVLASLQEHMNFLQHGLTAHLPRYALRYQERGHGKRYWEKYQKKTKTWRARYSLLHLRGQTLEILNLEFIWGSITSLFLAQLQNLNQNFKD